MNTDIEMTDVEENVLAQLPEEYQDPGQNFRRLFETLEELKTWDVFPKDWVREQKQHIRIYCEIIPRLKACRGMEGDTDYARVVKKVEANLRVLEEGLRNKQLVLDAYGYFLEDLIKAVTMFQEMNELCDLVAGM